ncbi:hypothetical protein SAMD00019534_106990 [Acytostelium subglobosum LB1]|uniref:hypothetical protein n=1 Tax=Acytostelium subglobosum LB1 TaxID=1410327 RepID=UPI00064498FC|nr:hypothetical protein SAMD00019534_106990 [Acytostelium subglobosum LB1]GAM27523.1 hypothetical protein SAMD00019534_106990 [Acytostelium subglobosum LB1]|eukprot:XP_012749588.1 hypothetical protein SAMD00019534_106990 [Acytostelium subglobosum LB1]
MMELENKQSQSQSQSQSTRSLGSRTCCCGKVKLPPKGSTKYIKFYTLLIALLAALCLSGGLYLLFQYLLPSIREADRFVLTTGTVIRQQIIQLNTSHDCQHFDHTLWWDDQGVGTKQMFFHYVSNGSATSGYDGGGGSADSADDSSNSNSNMLAPCYYGITTINVTLKSSSYQPSLVGLSSSNYNWVAGYTHRYVVNETYEFYVDGQLTTHALWFHPRLYSHATMYMSVMFALVAVLLFMLVACLAVHTRRKVTPIPNINAADSEQHYTFGFPFIFNAQPPPTHSSTNVVNM